MSEINIQLVREFFELNRFRVLTHWQHDDEQRRGVESGLLLFVEQVGPESTDDEPPFLLDPQSIARLQRAVVEVRAWHGDKFYPSVIESSPILGHVASQDVAGMAQSVFGAAPFASVLVISELPTTEKPRGRSLALLQGLGLTHVLEFSTMLAAMLEQLSSQSNYAPSHTLQTLRLLKRYDLVRRQQLEFRFPMEPDVPSEIPCVDVTVEEHTE
jgi:hypothetical protein